MFRWYVVNTYSGHENKVKHNLEHRGSRWDSSAPCAGGRADRSRLGDEGNQKITVEKRTMPGYVLVNMELNEDSWGVVKGTPGVTGFVGASQAPVPLTQWRSTGCCTRRSRPRRAPARSSRSASR